MFLSITTVLKVPFNLSYQENYWCREIPDSNLLVRKNTKPELAKRLRLGLKKTTKNTDGE